MFIPPENIIPELRSTERYAAIRELLQRLMEVGAISSRLEGQLFSAFQEREEVMTTGVGSGCAIPHITTDAVKEQIFAMGRSEHGVDFASLDGKPAKTVILIIFPRPPRRSRA